MAKSPLSPDLKGAFLMIAGTGVLSLNDGIAKWLTEAYPVGQIMAIRGTFVIAMILVWAVAFRRTSLLRVRDWRNQSYRAVLMMLSTIAFITGLSLLPLATAISITFAGPLITTVLAIPLLGEMVGWRRWSAILIGFVGVLIMLRPSGNSAIEYAALLPIAAAMVGAFRDIVTRKMRSGETPVAILLISTIAVTIYGYASASFAWVPFDWSDIWFFALTAALMAVAQLLTIEAFHQGTIGFVAPFKYTSMIWAVLIGIVVWGEMPGLSIYLGSALVIASGFYILRREAALRANRE